MRSLPPPASVKPTARGTSRGNVPQGVLAAAVLAALLPPAAAQAQFAELPRHTLPALPETRAFAAGDLDGDGDADLVLGCGGQNRMFRNDGGARFTDVTAARLPPASDWTRTVALGDVDGDGDLDLVCGNDHGYPDQTRLYLANAAGVFSDATSGRLPGTPSGLFVVALADVDRDGDLDLLLGGGQYLGGVQPRLYRNDGTGTFADVTATALPVATPFTNAIVFADVDGDQDLDVVLGNTGTNQLWLNDGTGTFTDATAARLPRSAAATTSLALGDVDGDGDLDLVCGTMAFAGGGCWGGKVPYYLPPLPDRLFLNDGTGSFAPADVGQLPATATHTTAIVLGDVDDDGDLDLVCASTGTAGLDRLYRNDGTGSFTDVTATQLPAPPAGGTFALALCDLDGDGDLDLLRSSGGVVLLNLRRQLHAPAPLRAGHAYTLDAYCRHGSGGTLDFALPYLSLSRAAVPVPPLGTLGIVPMAPLPLIAIQQPPGVGSAIWSVPNQPALAGLSVYAQALLVEFPLSARLTNVVGDVLLP